MPYLPAASTFKEQGYDFTVAVRFGLLTRKGTPQPVVETLRRVVAKVANAPATEALYGKFNFYKAFLDGEGFQKQIDAVAKLRVVLKDIGPRAWPNDRNQSPRRPDRKPDGPQCFRYTADQRRPIGRDRVHGGMVLVSEHQATVTPASAMTGEDAKPMPDWDALWIGANLATMVGDGEPYGALPDAAIGTKNGRIAWVGSMDDLPAEPDKCARAVHDVARHWITPGLIDCHTHLVFGGNRAGEFEMRLKGASYEEIARAGGGIVSTMRATREADDDTLFGAALPRLRTLLAEGVTTVEIKSGYGLETETEIRQLRVARRLGEALPVEIKTTFLGAHALPPEYTGRQGAYIDLVVEEMLPAVAEAGIADAVDGFCETIGFTAAEINRVFEAARSSGLPVKLHADQLSDYGGAALAARFGALSADHLEYASDAGIAEMAGAGTVAVLLPGAFYTLRETRLPPIGSFRGHQLPMAIATDFNPGSSPTPSLLLMLNMACTLFRLTPEEALAGVTRVAAQALGLGDDRGTLETGKRADFVLWEIEHPAELA